MGARSIERFTPGQQPRVEAPRANAADRGQHLDTLGIGRVTSTSTTVILRAGRVDRAGRMRWPSLHIERDGDPPRTIDLTEPLGGPTAHLTGLLVDEERCYFIAGPAGAAQVYVCELDSGAIRVRAPAPRTLYTHSLVRRGGRIFRLGAGLQILGEDFSVHYDREAGASDVALDGTRAAMCVGGDCELWDLGPVPKRNASFPLHRVISPSHVVADPRGRFLVFAHGNALDVVDRNGTLLCSKQPRGKAIVHLAIDEEGRVLVVTWKFTDVYEVVFSEP